MILKKSYIGIELFVLFFVLPLLLAAPLLPILKISSLFIGVIYCVIVAKRLNLIMLKSLYAINFKGHITKILITFVLIIIATTGLVYLFQPENLFLIVLKKPEIWVSVVLFYSIFSVYPQELLYRAYFFNRYQNLFENKNYLLLLNIIAFPIAHLFFKNELVLIITFIGGVFFAYTYYKSKSVLLTSIEHAIYGSWLFTVGMGEMLAFPMPH